jgi:predicted PurR-regulated permease PerM
MNDAPAASSRPHSTWVARALLAVAVVFLLENAKPLMLPIVIAVAFTFVLAAPVRWLRRRGMPDYLGAGLVIAAVLSVVALLVSLLAAPAAEWWARAPGTVHRLIESAQQLRVSAFPEALSGPPRRPGIANAPGTPAAATLPAAPAASAPGGTVVDPFTEQLTTEGMSITRAALGQMLSFTVAASATVFLLYFLLASEHWLIARTVEAIPRRRSRALLLSGIRQAQVEIGLFITTMGLISIGLGIATGVALAAIGFPNPVLWGTTDRGAHVRALHRPGACYARFAGRGRHGVGHRPRDAGAAGALPRTAFHRKQFHQPADHGRAAAHQSGLRVSLGAVLELAVGDCRRFCRRAAAARVARRESAQPALALCAHLPRCGRPRKHRAAEPASTC